MRPWLRMFEAGLDALSAINARHSRSPGMRRKVLGDTGERRAYFHLCRLGYVVVARKWQAPNLPGEIDLIAWHGETLCFIEVKTRASRDRYAAERNVHADQERSLRRMARAYVRGLYSEGDLLPAMRVDAVTVLRLRREWRVEVHPDAMSLASD